jgi:hypothetical protein
VSLNAFLSTHTPLKFFNLTEMEILVYDHYMNIALTAQFDHRALQDALFETNYWLQKTPEDYYIFADLDEFAYEIQAIKEQVRAAHAMPSPERISIL